VLGLLLFGFPSVAEQGESGSERPRVVLVLSGGGARGGAHLGVLEVLEEARVPVDLIIGTSMGAVIGSLYASGLSPDFIAQELEKIDWDDLLNDKPPRRQLPFRRKVDDALGFTDLELGVSKSGLSAPSGFIAGQKLGFMLQSFLLHTSDTSDFDDLAIPFRAVAADLDAGEPIVIGEGSLAIAVRASMAIPLAFAPVVQDGRTLVDGGIVLNLPVETALEMGAEHIVAVNISTPLGERKEDLSAFGIFSRTFTVLMQENVRDSLAELRPSDLLISPDLGAIGTADFEETLTAAGRGEQAARDLLPELSRFAVSEEDYDAYLERHRAAGRRLRESVKIDEVEVVGNSRVDSRLLLRRIETQPGSELDLDMLFDDLERLYELGEFQQVSFRVDRREPGTTVLVIEVRENDWDSGFVRFGLGLEANLEGSGFFTLFADYTRTQVNRRGGEWKTYAGVGSTDRIFTELYQPLMFSGTFFVAPRVEFEQSRTDSFVDEELLRIDEEEWRAGFDFGAAVRNYGEFRLGPVWRVIKGDLLTGPAVGLDDTVAGARLLGFFDMLDNPFFPRAGWFTRSGVMLARESFGSDFEYDRLEVRGGGVLARGRKQSLFGSVGYGTGFGGDIPVFDEFTLGGFLRLSGLERDQLRGDNKAIAKLHYYHEVAALPSILGSAMYVGASVESGKTWLYDEPSDLDHVRTSFTGFFGFDSLVGPFYVGYGWSDRGQKAFYFFLGNPLF
jgi:NTE family protein